MVLYPICTDFQSEINTQFAEDLKQETIKGYLLKCIQSFDDF